MKLSEFLRHKHNQAIFALIIANTIWGAASPIFKLALENISPFTLAFVRFFGATFLLLPFALIRQNNKVFSLEFPSKKDWSKIIALSVCGITINITFFFFGLKLSPSINAPIIASAGPLVLYIFSLLILKEKSHPKVLAGTLVSLFGVLIVIGKPIIDGTFNGELLGNLFLVFAMMGAVGHAIISKEILDKYHVSTITFWSFLIGSITFLPFFIYELRTTNSLYFLDYRGWLGIIFGVFLSSALAYFLFEWAVKKLQAQEVGIFTYIDPIVAILIAIPLLSEKPSLIYILGSIFVFLGIFIAEGRLHWHPVHKLKH